MVFAFRNDQKNVLLVCIILLNLSLIRNHPVYSIFHILNKIIVSASLNDPALIEYGAQLLSEKISIYLRIINKLSELLIIEEICKILRIYWVSHGLLEVFIMRCCICPEAPCIIDWSLWFWCIVLFKIKQSLKISISCFIAVDEIRDDESSCNYARRLYFLFEAPAICILCFCLLLFFGICFLGWRRHNRADHGNQQCYDK